MLLRFALPAVVLFTATHPIAAQVPTPMALSADDSTRIVERGHTFMRWIVAGRTDSLTAAMTPEFLEGMGGAAEFAKQIAILGERGGAEISVPIERLTRRGGFPQFWHEANFIKFADEPLVIRLVFDQAGNVTGMGLGPKSTAKWDH